MFINIICILDAVLFKQICYLFDESSVKFVQLYRILIRFYNKYNNMIFISLRKINDFTFERR